MSTTTAIVSDKPLPSAEVGTVSFSSKKGGLECLNRRFIFVRDAREIYDLLDGHRMSVADFVGACHANLTYRHVKSNAEGEETFVYKKLAKEWIEWPDSRELKSFTYVPGKPRIYKDELNLWRQSNITARPGLIGPWTRLLDHVFAGKPVEDRTWFEQWCAFPIKYPGTKLHTAVLVYGGQGIGKTLITDTLKRLYGPDNAATISKHQLESNFTKWAEAKQFIVCDEIVVQPKDRPILAEKLKGLITNSDICIEGKHANGVDQTNYFNLIFTSNPAAALPIEDDDRRFFVVGSTASPVPDTLRRDFIAWRDRQFSGEVHKEAELLGKRLLNGLSALMAHFQNMDLTRFDPYAPAPRTSAKQQMLETISAPHINWLRRVKDNPDAEIRESYDLFTAKDLSLIYRDRFPNPPVTDSTLGAAMSSLGFSRAHDNVAPVGNGKRRHLWIIRHPEKYVGMAPTEVGKAYQRERDTSSLQNQSDARAVAIN